MSIIHVNQIANKIEQLFQSKVDVSDLNPSDQEYRTKVLTRCLAAYAVYCIGGANEVEAANSVIDGANDNGIDAIYYSPANKRMILVQSKWSKKGVGEPESGDMRKFKDGVFDLLGLDFSRFNDKTRNMQALIETALTAYDTKFDIVLIHTGNQLISTHSQRVMNDLVAELNDAGDGVSEDVVTFHQLNQAKVHASLAGGMEGEPIDLEIGLSQWGKVEEPHTAFFGMVSGDEVFNWYKSKGKRLFSKNIRQMLGSTDVNDEISTTIEKTPEKFWYFNNGVTLVADSIKKSMVGGNGRDIGSFRAANISIVNGAQTVSTVGGFDESELSKLEKVKIPIKLISLENAGDDFGANVTKTNNRQNRIENRDFVSLDEQQLRLRTELAIEGIEYNIVRSESFKSSVKSFDLSEATIALACASNQVSLAVQAKREIGKFYENLSKAPYKSIFNPNVTGVYVSNVVKSLRVVEQFLNNKIDSLTKKSGREYGFLVHGNRMIALLVFSDLNLSKVANDYEFDLNSLDIEEAFEKIVETLSNQIDEHYPDKILGTLFKNATICKDLYRRCI
ncbi:MULTISPECIES: AIPR family protein [unclassified Pseudoalteromonas]|uniref:AIPR family protein n=1 Tax=unclassified Pseudoalteromonas TaxID=194690 RepID=UPI00209830A7|nr:AIPR family protein [Pseudoalteromonas sp. XMcav2-N]MCO7188625.1 AIPR family protein [Pseudoalteromonas sp. XMcav2-N]